MNTSAQMDTSDSIDNLDETTNPAPTNPRSKRIEILLLLVMVLALVGFAVKLFLDYQRGNTNSSDTSTTRDDKSLVQSSLQPSSSPTPSPSPIIPIIKGEETYRISQGKEIKGVKFVSLQINPHDPDVGGTQEITATLAPSSKAEWIKVLVVSDDKKSYTVNLTRTIESQEGDKWYGKWTVNTTHKYTYSFEVQAKEVDGPESKITISVR